MLTWFKLIKSKITFSLRTRSKITRNCSSNGIFKFMDNLTRMTKKQYLNNIRDTL